MSGIPKFSILGHALQRLAPPGALQVANRTSALAEARVPQVRYESRAYWWLRAALAPLVLLNMAFSGILQVSSHPIVYMPPAGALSPCHVHALCR